MTSRRADTLAVSLFALLLLATVWSLAHPRLVLWVVAGCVLWVAVSVSVALLLGRAIGGPR